MFSTKLFTARRLLQQIKVSSRHFSSNWSIPLRKSPSISALVAVTITGTSLYCFNKVYCAEERERRTQKFKGKTVLITGAAGDLGSTVGRAFSEQGARIVLCDLAGTEPKLKQLTTELLSLGSPAVIYASVDVSVVEDVKKCVETAVKEFGNIDILFNNAGICCDVEPVQESDEAVFKRTQDVNVYGVFLMMKYVSNKMIESGKGGVIINVSSIAGLQGNPFLFSYVASKFAINGMTRAAAKSLSKHNIRVNALAPGYIEGSMGDRIFREIAGKVYDSATEENIEELKIKSQSNNPMGRPAKTREVAEVVLFLSSEEASYINGVVLPVDGGLLA